MHKTLHVKFLSDWQISSGIGDGHWADSMLVRDSDGLPYIPGRALKGALREGAHRLSLCRTDLAKVETALWGTKAAPGSPTIPGLLQVSPGILAGGIREALLAVPDRDAFVRDLTCRRVQTALDDDRQVVNRTLRKLECGIAGLEFTAELVITVDKKAESWIHAYLRAVCAAVKSMGGNRSRGLGLCRVTLGNDTALPDLPPAQDFLNGGTRCFNPQSAPSAD